MHAILREPRQYFRRRALALAFPLAINAVRFRNNRDVCFVWVPKTAGTSVYQWLNRELGMLKAKDLELVEKAFPQRGPVTFGYSLMFAELGLYSLWSYETCAAMVTAKDGLGPEAVERLCGL